MGVHWLGLCCIASVLALLYMHGVRICMASEDAEACVWIARSPRAVTLVLSACLGPSEAHDHCRRLRAIVKPDEQWGQNMTLGTFVSTYRSVVSALRGIHGLTMVGKSKLTYRELIERLGRPRPLLVLGLQTFAINWRHHAMSETVFRT